MSQNSKEDFSRGSLGILMMSFFSRELRVGIIGAGRAGYIKARRFAGDGCYTEVLYRERLNLFENIKCSNLRLIEGSYEKSFIEDKHLIVIAVDDYDCACRIERDCKEAYKIYINCTDAESSMGSIPAKSEMNNFTIGITSKGGNPKGSVFLAKKASESLKEYDDFIGFTTYIRNNVKKTPEIKKVVTDFIATDDFYEFYKKGKAELVLRMFFKEQLWEND